MTSQAMTPGKAAEEAPEESPSWRSKALLLLLRPPPHPPSQQQPASPRRWEREGAAAAPPRACGAETVKENPRPLVRTLRLHPHPSSRGPPPRLVLWLSFRVRR